MKIVILALMLSCPPSVSADQNDHWVEKVKEVEGKYDFSLKENHKTFLIDLKKSYQNLSRIQVMNALLVERERKPRGYSNFCEWIFFDSLKNDDRILLQLAIETCYFDDLKGETLVEQLSSWGEGKYFPIIQSAFKCTKNMAIRREIVRGLRVYFKLTADSDIEFVERCVVSFVGNDFTLPERD